MECVGQVTSKSNWLGEYSTCIWSNLADRENIFLLCPSVYRNQIKAAVDVPFNNYSHIAPEVRQIAWLDYRQYVVSYRGKEKQ